VALVKQDYRFVTEYSSVVDEENGRGVLLAKEKPFFVIDIPNQTMLLNRSRLPGRQGWRWIFNLIDNLAFYRFAEDSDEDLGDSSKVLVGDCYYSPYGLPEEMYVETYSQTRFATFGDGRPVLDEFGNQKIVKEGGECIKRPKIKSVYASEIDEYVKKHFNAHVEPKRLVFDDLVAA
jgi:hypothetical protein